MRRPNILFMNRVYPPVRGATGRVLRDLAHAFARDGWHVTVVTTGEKAGQELDGNVRIVRVKGSQKPANVFVYFWIWVKMLIVALRLKRRHLIVTLSDPPLVIVAGQIVAHFKKSKHVNWCHDLYPDIMPALGYKLPDFVMRFLKKLSRRSMRSCEKVIVNGRCMAKHLAYDGLDPKMIAMIPNWPDLELVDPELTEGIPEVQAFHSEVIEGMRPHAEQLKDGQRFRVLYSGNLGRAHTISTVLDAAEILNKENSDVEFVFVGDGKQFDFIAEQRAKRSLDNVRLLPYQPASRLREMMESGDVHLITMKDEAAGCLVPSKLYAALAVARPCIFIGPEQTEAAKVIQDFKTGVVVANGEAEDLAEAIRIFRNDGQIWFAAHRGAARAREVFTPHESLDAWMERAFAIIKDDLKRVKKAAA